MSLSEIMSAHGGHLLVEIAFVLFVLAMACIAYMAFSRKGRDLFERASSMPLDDAPVVQPTHEETL